MLLWEKHLGGLAEVLKAPESLKCMRLVNQVARENWERYTDEGKVVEEMQGPPDEVSGGRGRRRQRVVADEARVHPRRRRQGPRLHQQVSRSSHHVAFLLTL